MKTKVATIAISMLLALQGVAEDNKVEIYRSISKLLHEGNLEDASKKMTKKVSRRFVTHTLNRILLSIANDTENSSKLLSSYVGKKSCQTLGFDVDEIRTLSTQGDRFAWETFVAEQANRLKSIEDEDKRNEQFRELFKLAERIGVSEFGGSILEHSSPIPQDGGQPPLRVGFSAGRQLALSFRSKKGTLLYAGPSSSETNTLDDEILGVREIELSGKGFDDKEIDLADYRCKWLIIDFWGTWCAPCLEGLPKLRELLDNYGGKLAIIGVAIDDKATLKNYLEDQENLSWPNILDPKGALSKQLNVKAYPTYFLINPEGLHVPTPMGLKQISRRLAKEIGEYGDETSGDFSAQKTGFKDATVGYPGLEKPVVDDEIDQSINAMLEKISPEWGNISSVESFDDRFPAKQHGTKQTVADLVSATVVISGSDRKRGRWTAGGVLVSSQGLVMTNQHVIGGKHQKILVMTPDGKFHRVVKRVSANKRADVALIQLEGEDFPFVDIAQSSPSAGDSLVSIHHSEGRFFTYDQGYVKRHTMEEGQIYTEVFIEYGVGGSGCGIYNARHELVGLVCLIEQASDGDILWRKACSWHSIRSLWPDD